jgi:hypothetical protein
MSEESDLIKNRIEFFNSESERVGKEAARAGSVRIEKLPFSSPRYITPTVENPTGNPLLYSPTGYIPGPRGKPAPAWLKPPINKKTSS